MNASSLTSSDEYQFYPTPPELAQRMLKGVEWNTIKKILEPSAGNGNLIETIGECYYSEFDFEIDGTRHRYIRNNTIEVDCVEIDPYLRSILKYKFSIERKHAVYEEMCDELKRRKGKEDDRYFRAYESDYTPLYQTLDKMTVCIVHDNFLTFKPYNRYDLIVMNPPFADGDKHLLHALGIQRHGGGVICLLNAETLRNPFTNSRKELKKRLDELGAEIEYVEDAFADAERSADVDVAIVRAFVPVPEERSVIFERLEKSAEAEEFNEDVTDLVVNDYIKAAVRQFNVECKAGIELVREYVAMSPRILCDLGKESYNTPILKLTLDSSNELSVNSFLRLVRLKYWRGLFSNEKFMRRLTMTLRDQYLSSVERMQDYDFTMFNIQSVIAEMNAQIMTGVQQEILKMFDKLTADHSWYPECKQNIHYYSGWKTNQAHKIGKKSIIPEYLQSYSWSRDAFDVFKAYGVLSDIEKIFDYLSGRMEREPTKLDIHSALKAANALGQTQNIECTYFTITIYKKGTVHIKYTCPDLVDRLNIYAAQNRNWLPPNYGKTSYADMTDEERAVVNDFHRDEKEKEVDPKKIAERYARIMARREFYLADPASKTHMLTASV
jgi:hypothetical protein